MRKSELNKYYEKLTERLNLQMSYADAMHLLGQLTLALRHPRNIGSSAEVVRVIGATLANCVIAHLDGHVPDQILKDWQTVGFLKKGELN